MTDKKDKDEKVAVSLHYDEKTAPRVTAKGSGDIAESIIAYAKEENIPLMQDPALSALLSQIELGDLIPESLYVAVAEVLAFAYRMNDRYPKSHEGHREQSLEDNPDGEVYDNDPAEEE